MYYSPFQKPDVKGVTLHLKKYAGFHLPTTFSPERFLNHQSNLADEMADYLNVSKLTPVLIKLNPMVWMLAYLHSDARPRRVSTYDEEGPGTLRYQPRLAVTFVFDLQAQRLFVSLPNSKIDGSAIDYPLRSVFPGRDPACPLIPLDFSLERLLTLPPECRSPTSAQAPWRHLFLKSITWQAPGKDAPANTTKWAGDGFEDLLLNDTLPSYDRIYMATFQVHLPNHKRCVVQLYPKLSTLGIAFSPANIPAYRALLTTLL